MDPEFANDPVSQRAEGGAAEAREEERRLVVPPVSNVLPKGAVSVRDYRLWHRGIPNVRTFLCPLWSPCLMLAGDAA